MFYEGIGLSWADDCTAEGDVGVDLGVDEGKGDVVGGGSASIADGDEDVVNADGAVADFLGIVEENPGCLDLDVGWWEGGVRGGCEAEDEEACDKEE